MQSHVDFEQRLHRSCRHTVRYDATPIPFRSVRCVVGVSTSAPLPLNRRERRRSQIASAKASRAVPGPALDPDAPPVLTIWRSKDLPMPHSGECGVPLVEGVTSVFAGSLLYIPFALASGYSLWNYPIAAVLVIALSYALWSRRVVVGSDFVAVRKFGPYRLALRDSIVEGGMKSSQHGGVLTLHTGDGHLMRLRRIEFTHPDVNRALRQILLSTDKPYDSGVMQLLDLPWRADFGHQRYLLDAVQ